ncbi:fatty acid synthase alpha subunit Lsd1 [Coemansia aciculifera]|nr:fatty acid synthase alpha subunit Lsd1 [Coemansia aciculifera]
MDNYIEETRSVYTTYRPLVANFVDRMCKFLQREAAEPAFARLYHNGLDVRAWLVTPECTPAQEYMVSVPVSIPVVGLTQLMQVVVLYKTLGISPAKLALSFEAISGHSQGIATAAALAMAAADEDAFFRVCESILGLLMLTGAYPQLDYPAVTVTASAWSASAAPSSAVPTPMVLVTKLSRLQLESAIQKHNLQQQASADTVYMSLINTASAFVVSGATESIEAFVELLYREHDSNGADQTRVSHSQRKPGVFVKYLSINAPYHCPLLTHAYEGACEYATRKGWVLDARNMLRPVRAGDDGHDIRNEGNNLSHYLLKTRA